MSKAFARSFDEVALHFKVKRTVVSSWRDAGCPFLTKAPYDLREIQNWVDHVWQSSDEPSPEPLSPSSQTASSVSHGQGTSPPKSVCPICEGKLEGKDKVCPHCGTLLQLAKLADRQVVFVLDRGLITFAKFTAAAISLMIAISVFAVGLDIWKGASDVRKMKTEVEGHHKRTEEFSRKLSESEEALDQVSELNAAAASVYASLGEIKNQQDRLLLQLRREKLQTQDSKVYPVRPTSVSDVLPSVVFGGRIHFHWYHGGHLLNKETFHLQVSKDPKFPPQSLVLDIESVVDTYMFAPQSQELVEDLRGRLHWRVGRYVKGSANQEPEWGETASFDFYADEIDRILKTNRIVVGTTTDEGSFAKLDGSELTGFDVDLAKKVVELLPSSIREIPSHRELQLEFATFSWDDLFTILREGQVDLILAGITITDDREERYGLKFSTPYFTTTQSAVWMKDDQRIGEVSDLAGKSIVVQTGTRGEEIASAFTDDPYVIRLAKSPQLFEALMQRRASAIIVDYDYAKSEQTRLQGTQGVVVRRITSADLPERIAAVDKYGIAVAKNGPLLLRGIDKALDTLRTQGQIDSLYKKYDFTPYVGQ